MVFSNVPTDVSEVGGIETLEPGTDTLDGAAIRGLSSSDRDYVTAFMDGLSRNRQVCRGASSFDTVASRLERGLYIQCRYDGDREHVIQLARRRDGIDLVYRDTDEHRVLFFRRLLRTLDVDWLPLAWPERKSGTGICQVQVGAARAPKQEDRIERFRRIAACLPFLPLFAEARSTLGRHCGPGRADWILLWAARTRVGHVAFLEQHGDRLIEESLTPIQNDAQALCDLLGEAGATRFLKKALAVCWDASVEGRKVDDDLERVHSMLRHQLLPVNEQAGGVVHDLAETCVEEAEELRSYLGLVVRREPDQIARVATALERLGVRGDLRSRRMERLLHAGSLDGRAGLVAWEIQQARRHVRQATRLGGAFGDSSHGSGLWPTLERLADRVVQAAQGVCRATASPFDHPSRRSDLATLVDSLESVVQGAREEENRARGWLIGAEHLSAGFVVTASALVQRLTEACDSLREAVARVVDAALEFELEPTEDES